MLKLNLLCTSIHTFEQLGYSVSWFICLRVGRATQYSKNKNSAVIKAMYLVSLTVITDLKFAIKSRSKS